MVRESDEPEGDIMGHFVKDIADRPVPCMQGRSRQGRGDECKHDRQENVWW
jgi:hypothetical protein